MATLNSTYQYIGKTNGLSSSNTATYYILLYAKTTGSISTGKHTVSVKMRMVCNKASTFYGYYSWGHVKVDGANAYIWDGVQMPNSAWNTTSITEDNVTYPRWIDLKECSTEVDVGYGVTKNVTVGVKWVKSSGQGTPPTYVPTTTDPMEVSITVTLPMIASASTITSAGAVTLGNACSVTWTPQASSFRYKLTFAIGTWSYITDAIHPNRTTAYTYNSYKIPISVANQISTKTGTMTVTLKTYSDSNCTSQIGSADSETFTVTVPNTADTRPTVSMTLEPVSTLSAPFDSMYIQGKSKVKATLTASAKPGATIEVSSIYVEGTYYGYPYESSVLSRPGNQTVSGDVKDSRGHFGSTSDTITVIPYSRPKVQAVSGERNVVAARCDKDGNLSDSGTYLKIKAQRSYEPVMSNGSQRNFCHLRYRYKSISASSYSYWQTLLAADDLSSNQIDTEPLLNGLLAADTSYVVQIQAIDDVGEHSEATINIPTEDVYWHRTRNGLGLGKYCEGENLLDVDWDARFGKSINGVHMRTTRVDNDTVIRLQSCFDKWDYGTRRQTFFVFGNANTLPVIGIFTIKGDGSITNNNITNCSATCEENGVVRLDLGTKAWDDFVIISPLTFIIL